MRVPASIHQEVRRVYESGTCGKLLSGSESLGTRILVFWLTIGSFREFWNRGRKNWDTMTAVFDYGPLDDDAKGFQVVYSSRMTNSAGVAAIQAGQKIIFDNAKQLVVGDRS